MKDNLMEQMHERELLTFLNQPRKIYANNFSKGRISIKDFVKVLKYRWIFISLNLNSLHNLKLQSFIKIRNFQKKNMYPMQSESDPHSLPHHQPNSIYWCQCGKKYLSFPALYLHAKTKHSVKLTSKLAPDVCKIQTVNGVKEITYFIKNNQNIDPNQVYRPGDRELRLLGTNERSRSQKNLNVPVKREVLGELFSAFYKKFPEKEDKILFQAFQRYLEDEFNKKWTQSGVKTFVCVIPYFLNPFAVEEATKIMDESQQNLQWKKICQELLSFGVWLKENQYTNLQVQCDIL